MSDEFVCRAMQREDLIEVIRIQAEAYAPEFLESDEVIHTRFDQAPETAWIVERASQVCGYLVAYQTPLGKVTPWGSDFAHQPEEQNLYLHDLAISETATGCGLGPLLVGHALKQAKISGLQTAALVSVQNSKQFWHKQGFEDHVELHSEQQSNLETYAFDAYYMSCELT